jgi:ssDNA thymidine ADP-ribosyltransferase, DarT
LFLPAVDHAFLASQRKSCRFDVYRRPAANSTFQADLHRVVAWAESEGRRWAFSNGNAGTRYTRFFNNLEELEALDWQAIATTVWKDPIVKEHKQAEFLVEESFPWELIERIGVFDKEIAERAASVLSEAALRPEVVVAGNWYY